MAGVAENETDHRFGGARGLCHRNLGSSSYIQTFLQGVARKGNREFLARAEEKPED
jgi:hypothetical protein